MKTRSKLLKCFRPSTMSPTNDESCVKESARQSTIVPRKTVRTVRVHPEPASSVVQKTSPKQIKRSSPKVTAPKSISPTAKNKERIVYSKDIDVFEIRGTEYSPDSDSLFNMTIHHEMQQEPLWMPVEGKYPSEFITEDMLDQFKGVKWRNGQELSEFCILRAREFLDLMHQPVGDTRLEYAERNGYRLHFNTRGSPKDLFTVDPSTFESLDIKIVSMPSSEGGIRAAVFMHLISMPSDYTGVWGASQPTNIYVQCDDQDKTFKIHVWKGAVSSLSSMLRTYLKQQGYLQDVQTLMNINFTFKKRYYGGKKGHIVHTGSRGGKYILVNGKKKYV